MASSFAKRGRDNMGGQQKPFKLPRQKNTRGDSNKNVSRGACRQDTQSLSLGPRYVPLSPNPSLPDSGQLLQVGEWLPEFPLEKPGFPDLERGSTPINGRFGILTGFGSLQNKLISPSSPGWIQKAACFGDAITSVGMGFSAANSNISPPRPPSLTTRAEKQPHISAPQTPRKPLPLESVPLGEEMFGVTLRVTANLANIKEKVFFMAGYDHYIVAGACQSGLPDQLASASEIQGKLQHVFGRWTQRQTGKWHDLELDLRGVMKGKGNPSAVGPY